MNNKAIRQIKIMVNKLRENLNIRILFLQAIGICMVVFAHIGISEYFGSDLFKLYSFHMALFIFISGYLYKDKYDKESLFKYLWNKTKHLMIPFYIWLLVEGLITNCLLSKKFIFFGNKMTWMNFIIYPWTYGPKYSFTAAWWFIPILFACQTLNICIRKIIKLLPLNYGEYLYLVVAFVYGLVSVYMSRSLGSMYGGKMNQLQMLLFKVGVLFPFFQFGHLMNKWEDIVDKIPNKLFFIVSIIVELLMICIKGESIGYTVIHLSNFPSNPCCLYIVSINGILLWYKISGLLLPVYKDSKLIKVIGKNTWFILLHHQIVIFAIQLIFVFLSRIGICLSFDLNALISNEWYVYIPKLKHASFSQIKIVYALIALAVPIYIKLKINILIEWFRKIFLYRNLMEQKNY